MGIEDLGGEAGSINGIEGECVGFSSNVGSMSEWVRWVDGSDDFRARPRPIGGGADSVGGISRLSGGSVGGKDGLWGLALGF